jgi:hypothetical protein
MQAKFEAGHDTEPAAAAADGPEDIRIMIMIDDSRDAVGADDLDLQQHH